MGVAIAVRDVPDEVRDELAARAARSGQSLQEYVRGLRSTASPAGGPGRDRAARARVAMAELVGAAPITLDRRSAGAPDLHRMVATPSKVGD